VRTVKRFVLHSLLVVAALLVSTVSLPCLSVAASSPSYAQERLVSSAGRELSGGVVLLAKAASGGVGVEKGSIMLSMETRSAKDNLTKLVIAGYVAIWSFFYFTHDAGEVSE